MNSIIFFSIFKPSALATSKHTSVLGKWDSACQKAIHLSLNDHVGMMDWHIGIYAPISASILSNFFMISILICVAILAIILIAVLQLSLILSVCFLMVLKVSSEIFMALTMSAVCLLCSYLIITYIFSSRVIDFLYLLPLAPPLSLLACLLSVTDFMSWITQNSGDNIKCHLSCFTVCNCKETEHACVNGEQQGACSCIIITPIILICIVKLIFFLSKIVS